MASKMDLLAKLKAIIAEYGEANVIPTYMVEAIATDLQSLLCSSGVDQPAQVS